jgi:hypothetical protein
MSNIGTNAFTSGGKITKSWYDDREALVLRERVSFAGNMPFATLTKTWPAGARMIHACLSNPSALTPRAASSAAATNVAIMGVALVSTAPTALATNSATSNFILHQVQTAFAAAIPSNSVARGFAALAVTTAGGLTATSAFDSLINKTTSDVTLYLVPYASTVATDANGVGRFYVAGTTASTSQYTLNGTSTSTAYMDVEIHFERFKDIPAS